MIRPVMKGAQRHSRRRQEELRRTTGFAGERADIAHQVTWQLQCDGFTYLVALYGGHVVATGGDWNFQGNARIAELMKCSTRSVRRARAMLEASGLIASFLLLAGEMVPGQRAPVMQPRVVRFVGKLLELIGEHGTPRRGNVSSRGRRSPNNPSGRGGAPAYNVAKAPTAPVTPMSADDWSDLAELSKNPELSAIFQATAAAKRAAHPDATKPPPVMPAPISVDELEQWERETDRLEQLVNERQQRRERGPPN